MGANSIPDVVNDMRHESLGDGCAVKIDIDVDWLCATTTSSTDLASRNDICPWWHIDQRLALVDKGQTAGKVRNALGIAWHTRIMRGLRQVRRDGLPPRLQLIDLCL